MKQVEKPGRGREGFEWGSFFETAIVVSFLFVFGSQILARLISHWVGRLTEDHVELSPDYPKLARKYERENLLEVSKGRKGKDKEKFPFLPLAVREKNDPQF